MAFRPAQCPSCNREILVPDDADASLCMYCGQSILIKNIAQITVGPNIKNLLGMARTASTAGNLAEAEAYFNRVLELDPTISEAWIGKGKAAGWQSTLVNLRFGEVLTSFSHGIATAPEADKQAMIQSCLQEVNTLVVAIYGIANRHMIEFVAVQNTWTSYLEQVSQMLSTLETASAWSPTDRTTLENIVHLCKDIIEGVTYRDPFDNGTPKGWHLSSQYEVVVRQKLDAAAKAIQGIDPTYAPPTVQVKKPDSCFVVTATMGDPQHPTVCLMRKFRDRWILNRRSGVQFIAWYYEHGPIAAKLIRNRKWLRFLCYVLIVSPAAWLARRLTK